MAASFVVGYNKILEATEPRFLVLTGNESALREKVLSVIRNRSTDNNSIRNIVGGDSRSLQYATAIQSPRVGKEQTIFLFGARKVASWDWVPIWLNKVKGARIVVTDSSFELSEKLAARANTRGYCIDCSAPRGAKAQGKLAKLVAEWYDQSTAQVNHMLNKNNWRITECVQLLDKLALLNLPLTGDTIMQLGIVHDSRREFIDALTDDNPSLAMTTIPTIEPSSYFGIIQDLSLWLDKVSRVKYSQVYGKGLNDLAFEAGIPRADVEKLVREGRKYDIHRLNKLALTLAAADSAVVNGYTDGVLEVLVSTW